MTRCPATCGAPMCSRQRPQGVGVERAGVQTVAEAATARHKTALAIDALQPRRSLVLDVISVVTAMAPVTEPPQTVAGDSELPKVRSSTRTPTSSNTQGRASRDWRPRRRCWLAAETGGTRRSRGWSAFKPPGDRTNDLSPLPGSSEMVGALLGRRVQWRKTHFSVVVKTPGAAWASGRRQNMLSVSVAPRLGTARGGGLPGRMPRMSSVRP